METVHGWQDVPAHLKGASLAIGTFDGVHRGHRAVLDAARAKAAEGGLPMGVMVFEPYPRMFFQPQKPFFRLTGISRKLDLLSAYGCGFTAVIPFNREVAGLSARGFRAHHPCRGVRYQARFGRLQLLFWKGPRRQSRRSR